MQRQEITDVVFDIINKSLMTKKDIRPEHRLKEDLDMDSIGFVELGTRLEDQFNIDISDEDLEHLVTVSQVIDVVMDSPRYEA